MSNIFNNNNKNCHNLKTAPFAVNYIIKWLNFDNCWAKHNLGQLTLVEGCLMVDSPSCDQPHAVSYCTAAWGSQAYSLTHLQAYGPTGLQVVAGTQTRTCSKILRARTGHEVKIRLYKLMNTGSYSVCNQEEKQHSNKQHHTPHTGQLQCLARPQLPHTLHLFRTHCMPVQDIVSASSEYWLHLIKIQPVQNTSSACSAYSFHLFKNFSLFRLLFPPI